MGSLRMIARCSILQTSESERRQLIFWEPVSLLMAWVFPATVSLGHWADGSG
jgi:hypothetical protein